MKFEVDGLSVELNYDAEHFPVIGIQMPDIVHPDNKRPMVQISLNGVEIHAMKEQNDYRWNGCHGCGSDDLHYRQLSVNGHDGLGHMCDTCGHVQCWRAL